MLGFGGFVWRILLWGESPRPTGIAMNACLILAITVSNFLNGILIMFTLLERIQSWSTVTTTKMVKATVTRQDTTKITINLFVGNGHWCTIQRETVPWMRKAAVAAALDSNNDKDASCGGSERWQKMLNNDGIGRVGQ